MSGYVDPRHSRGTAVVPSARDRNRALAAALDTIDPGPDDDDGEGLEDLVDDPPFAWLDARDRSVTDAEAAACAREMQIRFLHLNPYEEEARKAKVAKLAKVLVAHHATATQADGLCELGRSMAAELARCHKPSPTTWAAVVKLLRKEEALARLG